jgi:hypothetical protein
MIGDILFNASLLFAKNNVTLNDLELPRRPIGVTGKNSTQLTLTATTSDQTVPLANVGSIGYVIISNLKPSLIDAPAAPVITNVELPATPTPTVTNVGTAGSTTVTYKAVGIMANGDVMIPSGSATTTTSNVVIANAAQNTVAASGTPANNDTVTVNGHVYTFKTTLTGAADEVHINGQDGSMTNLQSAINASGGVAGTDYGTGTVANTDVTAGAVGAVTAHTIYLTAIATGSTGNTYTLTKSGANLSVGAALFSWNYNHLAFVETFTPDHYDIYRTVSPTSPSTTGKIGTVASVGIGNSVLFDDVGLTGDGSSVPTDPADASTWTYKIVAVQADGSFTNAGSAGSTSTGRALITVNNYNVLTWTPVEDAVSYKIYRTVSGGTPSTTGRVVAAEATITQVTDSNNVTHMQAFDQGGTGDGTSATSGSPFDFSIKFSLDGGTLYPVVLRGQDFIIDRFNGASSIHYKALFNNSDFQITIIEA